MRELRTVQTRLPTPRGASDCGSWCRLFSASVGLHRLPQRCMYMPAVEVDDLLSGDSWKGEVDGVFEYQQIAWTPSFVIRDERSVSIVTRYWGQPPETPGLEIHGDHSILGVTTCANGSSPLGALGYSEVNVGDRAWRSWNGIDVHNGLTPNEAALLEDRFGPPIEMSVPAAAIAAAWFLLLWQPVLFVSVVVAGSMWLLRRGGQGQPTSRPS